MADRRLAQSGRIIFTFEQKWLHIRVRCVEHKAQLRLAGHFRQIVLLVHHVGDVENFLREHVADALALKHPFVRILHVHQLKVDGPDLPRHALGRPHPALLLLEEFKRDLAGAEAVGAAQLLAERANFALERAVQLLGRAAHVRQVEEVAVDVGEADAAHRIGGLAIVHEFAQTPVEQDRVEYAGQCLVHLMPFQCQFEHLRASVHFGACVRPSGALSLPPIYPPFCRCRSFLNLYMPNGIDYFALKVFAVFAESNTFQNWFQTLLRILSTGE